MTSTTNAKTSQLLSCDEMRDFWVSWESGTLELGKGSRYTWNLLSTRGVVEHDINAVSFCTGNGTSGDWQMYWDDHGRHL